MIRACPSISHVSPEQRNKCGSQDILRDREPTCPYYVQLCPDSPSESGPQLTIRISTGDSPLHLVSVRTHPTAS
ncbi:unnamed protein product [Fasciola hepatica]|uniref:Uncharacterized protein n=1 Tax=Fasciola hepatica TaxID=6192 RepID=A0ABC9HFN8_FASHE